VITAEHVVRGCDQESLVLLTASGAKTGVRDVVTDGDLDLALLVPEAADFVEDPLSLSQETSFTLGAQVSTWGYPDGYSGTVPLLTVGYLAGVEEEQSRSRCSATISPVH
jgi:S1-C subfamily serine protease